MTKYLLIFLLLFSCQNNNNDAAFKAKTNNNAETNNDITMEKEPSRGFFNRLSFNKTVNFAYDSSNISAEAEEKLIENIAWIKEKGQNKKILIAGHCDERGTKEYNLALGDRRAHAVKRFLVQNGIAAKNIETISYGEEKPIRIGTRARDYAANRRAEIIIQ